MTALLVTIFFTGILVALNERYDLFTEDRFAQPMLKWAAYFWLAGLIYIISALVVASARGTAAVDPSLIQFWQLFLLHALLVLFLGGWWVLAGRPPLSRFLNLQTDRLSQQITLGFIVGIGGWALTIMAALLIGLLLTTTGVMPDDIEPSPMIPWMAALPWWKRLLIVFSAMTVEEAFFRGWLQKRVGLIASTVVFAIAHVGYGQPFMLVGITVISLVIGVTFYYTRRLLPCIIAHGVFDLVQIFIIIPLALNFAS
jgi:membrane protease YdiL (CAAX protease family)